MSAISQEQLARIVTKAEALLGTSIGTGAAALCEMACERAMAFCGREDIPLGMEQAVASLLCAIISRESGVKTIQRGDTSLSFETAQNAEIALLRPWCRLGTLKKG